jgi:DNA-binding HxlR family transcriptional regulator
MESTETYRQSQALNTLPAEWESLGLMIRIVSARWMLAIIHQLAGGAKRPSYFYKIFPNLSAKTLTVRLRELEEYQLVRREAIHQRRLKVEYELTEKGHDLFALLQSLVEFGKELNSEVRLETIDSDSSAIEQANVPTNSLSLDSSESVNGTSGDSLECSSARTEQ